MISVSTVTVNVEKGTFESININFILKHFFVFYWHYKFFEEEFVFFLKFYEIVLK